MGFEISRGQFELYEMMLQSNQSDFLSTSSGLYNMSGSYAAISHSFGSLRNLSREHDSISLFPKCATVLSDSLVAIHYVISGQLTGGLLLLIFGMVRFRYDKWTIGHSMTRATVEDE